MLIIVSQWGITVQKYICRAFLINLVSLGILLQRSQHPYPDLDEQSFSIEWEFLYTFQLLTSILINQLELCQDSICIKQFLINGRQTQTASTRKIKNLWMRGCRSACGCASTLHVWGRGRDEWLAAPKAVSCQAKMKTTCSVQPHQISLL